MATKTYSHSWSLSGTRSSQQDTTITSSTIATFVANNIPPYSTINSVKVKIKEVYQTLGGSKGDWAVNIQANANTIGTEVYLAEDSITGSKQTLTSSDIKSYFKSGTSDAGALNGYAGVRVVLNALISRPWYVNGVDIIWDYTPKTYTATFKNYDGTVLQTVTVNHGSTPSYTGSTPTRASTAQYTYTFSGWSPSVGAISGNTTYTAQFTSTVRKYTINFKNADGSVVKTLSNVEYGKTFGTLPTVSRSGYTFGGWLPCAPAVKTDGTVLDSCQYTGDSSSFNALDKKYKYTDKLSLHIEAYMSSWEEIASLKSQIISCTEGGGWGLGYQANTTGHGSELYAGGYKGIDLGFGTAGAFSDKTWYSFDVVFSNGTFEAYVNGTKKGTQTTSSTAISYHSDNTIFVGAEAAKNATTPNGNYFKGYISNVFIANQGTRLVVATSDTTVTGNVDYYPIWRKNTACTATFKNHDGTVLQTVTVNSGSTPSYTGSTPTRASTAEYTYTFSGWSPSVGAITSDTTYTAQFTATKRSYTITVSGVNGSVTGGGTYEYGKTVTLTATPNTGYRFVKWSDNNTSNPRTVTVTGNATYTATFEVDPPEIISVTITRSSDLAKVTMSTPVEAGAKYIISVEVT